jgi:hypothetical protein
MNKFLLSFLFFTVLLIHNTSAQSPSISYQSPQTLYIGKPTTPITVKNTGGTVPNNLYPQDVSITNASFSLFGASALVMNSKGDFFVVMNSQIVRFSQDGTSSVFAGNSQWGTIDGTGTSAGFQEMNGIAIDAADNLYVTESNPYDGVNCKIRKITPAAGVTTFATGLPNPNGITVASNGLIYVSTYIGQVLKIASDGSSSLLAGQNGIGHADGTGANASFYNPSRLVTDNSGNVYIDDFGNSLIRKITPGGTVSTFAGSTFGSADGIGTAASFYSPTDIAIDSKQNLIIADGNGLVRKITPSAVVTTIAQPPYYDNQNNATYPSYPSTFVLDQKDNIISFTMNGFYKLLTTGFSISPVLPAGLTFGTDGSISGTPTVLSSQQSYTIRAQNSSGVSSTNISLQVLIPPDPPIIDSFTPITAPIGGLVTISGKYFTGTTAVTIGGQPVSGYSILSPTSISANVGTGAGSGNVTVTNLHGTASLSGFTLIPPPVISSFTPTSGGNGSVIAITGTGFTGITEVLIGGYYASFKVISPTQIQATVGSGATGDITIYGANGSGTLSGFTYINAPSISAISPISGGAGTTVTINGSNFSNATSVKFGTMPASSFAVVSPSQITATVASGSSNGITVSTPGGSISYSNFTYIPPPIITQVSPLTGGNGSIIYITGSNLSGAQVTIGGIPAIVGYTYSSAQISVTVGSGASGDIDVVTTSGTATFPGFIWVPAPVITSFSPQTAALGDKVTITGTNFTGVNGVSFGGVPSVFSVLSPTTIEATVGYGASGAVTVFSPGGAASLSGFVDLGPTITSFSPTQAGAGATVTINGTNFTDATAVNFGGVPATSFTINSSTQITAVVGQGKSGYVTVTSPEGTGVLAGFLHPGPSITYFSPGYAGPLSSSPIVINGTNFTGTTSVTFGGVPAASFSVLSSTAITAVAANAASGNVAVTTPLGSDKLSGFVWVQPPTISSIAPASQKSGNTVTISGTNFIGVTGVKFGGTPALGFFANSTTTIIASVGTGTSGDVTVSTVGGTTSIAGFTYISPVIKSVSPLFAAAGQTVTITGSNLDSIKTVQFGGVNAASFSIISSGTVTAVVGAGASGNVTVTGPSGSGSIGGFTFVAPPVIYAVTPNQGGAGTVVSISGSNLATVTGINIGGVPAIISSISDNLIKATVGTGATGMISVTTIAGTAQFDGFTWYPAPTITSASPLTAGAPTTVTITGTNFTGVTQVSFGSSIVGFTIVSPTEITAQPLYGSSGSITVTGPGGSAALPGFIFIPAPVITGFSTTGEGQNTVVTITGSNFDNTSAVQFGGIDAQSFTVISSNSITSIPGAGATGSITITTPGGTGTFAGFLYEKPPSIVSFLPAIGPIGTTVTISGDNFSTTAANNVVYFGPVKAKVINATQTQLQVVAPAGATGLITVSNVDKALSASSNLPFFITNSKGFTGFSNKFGIQFSSPVNSYAVEDFDGDGQPDLLIAKDDSIFILRHGTNPVLNGASFSQKIILETGRSAASMVVGDLDGDGKMDILYNIGPSLVVLHNTSVNGNISFDQTVIENIDNRSYDQMVLRDLDMDGRPDLIIGSGLVYPNTTVGSVISFGPPMFLANTDASSNISFALTDIDGDNKPEPILGSSYTGFSIFQNNSVPGSITAPLFPLTYILHNGYYYTPYTIFTADIDGDNKPDIIENDFSQSQFLVSRNLAVSGTINTASVAQPSAFSNSGFFVGMQAADMDGDGKIDVIGNSNTDVSWARNTSSIGNISFSNNAVLVSNASANNVRNVTAFDMDGDGRMDLVVLDGNTNKLTIYNNGPNTVPQITAVTPLAAGAGATITITGKYFDGTTAVNFGSKAANSFKVISSDTVTAVVGSGESGTIRLLNPIGAATFPGFTFILPPVLTSAIAATDGSGKLNITGSNLSTATVVTIAGTPAIFFKVNSDTSITAVFSDVAGILSVTTIGGTATLPDITVISNMPAIISISSNTAISGGSITLTGINFSGATSVSFGGTPATSFIVNSATNITAVVANGASGNVSVTTPSGSGTLGGFNFVPVPSITAGGPTTVLSDGPGVVLTAIPATGFSYQWINNGVNISEATDATYTATQSGLYTVNISLNGLIQRSATTTVTSVFQLPSSNFQLTITSETCDGSSDGFININAQQALNYTATINGNGLNKSYAFTDTTTINNLAAGTYSVCITVAGQNGYESCYDVTVTQPQPLSVYATVNTTAKSVDLALSGGALYLIELNGALYKTTDNKITLPLRTGNNNLKVTTDRLCQGSFEKLINASGTISVYPVPFQNTISVDIGNVNVNQVMIKMYDSISGKLVFTNQFSNQSGVLQLDVTRLGIGVYGLYVKLDNSQSFFKIIKQ